MGPDIGSIAGLHQVDRIHQRTVLARIRRVGGCSASLLQQFSEQFFTLSVKFVSSRTTRFLWRVLSLGWVAGMNCRDFDLRGQGG